MTKTRCLSLGKSEKDAINDDAAIARKNVIAVSDGAGGGGLFADRWSRYLLQKLPRKPIFSAAQLDAWISSIWEEYYNRAEAVAKRLGGMALDKFYDEGSFATLAAVWKQADGHCRWMAYGDSVVFRYDYASKSLSYSFPALTEFNNPPSLINCKDELNPEGFSCGDFRLSKKSFAFVASDALSHYIIMMYELSRGNGLSSQLAGALQAASKNANLVKKAMTLPRFQFEKEVIAKLRKAAFDKNYCKRWLGSLHSNGLLATDDYSLALMFE